MGFALLAIALLAAIFYYYNSIRTPRFDWNDGWGKEAYSEESTQPYGTQILHRLLKGYFPGKKVLDIRKSVGAELPEDSTFHGSYVFVGGALYLDSVSMAALVRFVKAGNTAFIASKTIPMSLLSEVFQYECDNVVQQDYAFLQDTTATVYLHSDSVRLQYVVQNKPRAYNWHYMDARGLCEGSSQRALGFLNDTLINFAELPLGAGRLLLHTVPVALSNYTLLRPDARPYIAQVLSHLPEGDIYWDAVSRVPEQVGRRRNNSDYRSLEDEHLLSYILRQPALAWAWYLLFGLAVLWFIFRAKRRQRVIPVLPKNENASYEFIETISNLHFRQRNYQGLCRENMKLFLAQIRERYNLITPFDAQTGLPRIDEGFLTRLAQVSERPIASVRDIFARYEHAILGETTEQEMVRLHLAMEAFWQG